MEITIANVTAAIIDFLHLVFLNFKVYDINDIT